MKIVYQLVDFGDGYEQYYGDIYESIEQAEKVCKKFNNADEYNNYGVIKRTYHEKKIQG